MPEANIIPSSQHPRHRTSAERARKSCGIGITWKYDNSQSGGGGPDGTFDSNDKTLHFAYDTRWRVVAMYRESDTSPKEQYVYQNAGLGGSGGSSYIDSVLLRDKDANVADEDAGDGVLEQRYYYCQNWRGDVVAIVKSGGTQVVEWVKYLAYGRPSVHPFSDAECDGDVDPSDSATFVNMYVAAQTTYFVRADTNLSGTITSADLTDFNTDINTWPNAGVGELSRNDATFNVANRIGFAGYQWDPIIKKYLARNRWLDPETGVWMRRDPIGYRDVAAGDASVEDDSITFLPADGREAVMSIDARCPAGYSEPDQPSAALDSLFQGTTTGVLVKNLVA